MAFKFTPVPGKPFAFVVTLDGDTKPWHPNQELERVGEAPWHPKKR